jgi:hypothetical protein
MNRRAAQSPGVIAELLLEIIDAPVSFHRCLVPITGGVTAALMVSQAIRITQELDPKANGWFSLSQDECAQATGLSRWEQVMARRALGTYGFMEERRAGMPAKLWFRVRPEVVSRALLARAEAACRSCSQAQP